MEENLLFTEFPNHVVIRKPIPAEDTSSMLDVTIKSANVLVPFTVTGSVAMPSTIKPVLLSATKGVEDWRKRAGSTSCEGARLTSAPLSIRQLWSLPVMRALR